jgi:diadenylate cyclase
MPKLTVTSVIDILAVAVLFYNFVVVLRGRRAMHVFNGLAVLAAAYGIAVWLKLELLRTVLAALAPYTVILLIVMFQSEIRRMLARIGRFRWLGLGRQLERREVVDDVVLAVEHMAAHKTGALIVLERDTGLRTFIESGVALDAAVSRDLLCSIFQGRGPLHDGAAIVQGDRVAAAACFLPLSANPGGLQRLGTRHRAAMGITEESDSVAVVVSEETGQIAVAARGELESDVSIDRLRELLIRHAAGRPRRASPAPEPQWEPDAPIRRRQ